MFWMNSKFQTLFFIVAKAHTFDNAYRVVCQQLLERERAQNEAKMTARIPNSAASALQVLDFQNAHRALTVLDDEVNFLRKLRDVLEPRRKFRDYPDDVAHQLSQREYWAHEFTERMISQIYAQGWINWDTLDAARSHPDYEDIIAPRVRAAMKDRNKHGEMLPPPQQSPLILFLHNVATSTFPEIATLKEHQQLSLKGSSDAAIA